MVQQLFAYHRVSENRLFHSALLDRLDQTAVCNNGLDKFRERCHVEFLAVGDVTDDAVVQVSLYGVALADASTASGHSTIARPMLMELR